MTAKSPNKEAPRGGQPPVLTFDLPALVERIRGDADRPDEVTSTLHREHGIRIVLVALRAHTDVPNRSAEHPTSLLVLDGSLRVNVNKKPTALAKGQLMTLKAGVVHHVEAPEDAVFLMTLATGDGG